MPLIEQIPMQIYIDRRKELVDRIKKQHNATTGIVVLIADFEGECKRFRQDPSFYYYTGIEEPACMLIIDVGSGKSTLYTPNFGDERKKWVVSQTQPGNHAALGVDAIEYTGKPCVGYQCYPFFTDNEYAHVIELFKHCISARIPVYTLAPTVAHSYIDQRFVLLRLGQMIDGFHQSIVDVSPIVATMRRKKSHRELELLYKAILITEDAHDAFARVLEPGKVEYELQATIEYMFTFQGASQAFPSIVATGKNGTVLHYMQNNTPVKAGDLVVVDIGADYNYYCADITRTYPVSGKFTDRQKEIYNLVLETQEYIASIAKPGLWLSNKNEPEQSLNHLAKAYLKERGYDQYFLHGIGHFLGIDVHDVGDYSIPLMPGDVITIEPGIYIADEGIGVRIEDDYWVVEDGVECLSRDLPKDIPAIEDMVNSSIE
ncbi:MAG: aminopeptidase P N-terminal domain-containing protein [Candidatus Babeliales bacterium]